MFNETAMDVDPAKTQYVFYCFRRPYLHIARNDCNYYRDTGSGNVETVRRVYRVFTCRRFLCVPFVLLLDITQKLIFYGNTRTIITYIDTRKCVLLKLLLIFLRYNCKRIKRSRRCSWRKIAVCVYCKTDKTNIFLDEFHGKEKKTY